MANSIEFSSLRIYIDNSYEDRVVIKCYGKLIKETAGELTRVAKPILGRRKHIALDLRDVHDIDSSGLGTIIALKVSAMREGLCSLELCSAGPPVLDLLRATNTLSALEWTGEEIFPHRSVLENREALIGDELRRNPDSRFSQVD